MREGICLFPMGFVKKMSLWELSVKLFWCHPCLVAPLVIMGRMDPWMPKHVERRTLSLWRISLCVLAEDFFFQAGPFLGESVLVLVEMCVCRSWILMIVGTCCNFICACLAREMVFCRCIGVLPSWVKTVLKLNERIVPFFFGKGKCLVSVP